MKTFFYALVLMLSFGAFAGEDAMDKACKTSPGSNECMTVAHKAFQNKECYKISMYLPKACDENNASACHLVGMCGIFSPKGSEEHKKAHAALTKACNQLKNKFACDDLAKFGK